MEVKREALGFSYWPMRRSTRRWGLHTMAYATDPWGVIDTAVVAHFDGTDRETPRSFVRQAREYVRAADGAEAYEAKPVLYYYGFLNLAKALSLMRDGSTLLRSRVHHGLKVISAAGAKIQSAELQASRSSSASASAFAELFAALTGGALGSDPVVRLEEVMSQIVVGHRLWREVGSRKERFIGVSEVRVHHDPSAHEIWATILLPKDTLDRRGRSVAEVLRESGLGADWRAVENTEDNAGRDCRRLELTTPVSYTGRHSDVVMELVDRVRPNLWRTITTTPPYRRYYLYLAPTGETRWPQLASAYALMFYLGHLTRYTPTDFISSLDDTYGSFIREFLASQPGQFLFEMACEFRRQEVTKAGIT
ncbi:MAG: YaaC family protein [Acidimicrobiia bacterium]